MVVASPPTTKYTHLELGKEVIFGIAGYYTPQQEIRLKHNGREVLYTIGQVVLEAACCGAGSWTYTIVPGYIVNWKNTKNEADLLVSEVEPVRDNEARADIRRTIEAREDISLIDFW